MLMLSTQKRWVSKKVPALVMAQSVALYFAARYGFKKIDKSVVPKISATEIKVKYITYSVYYNRLSLPYY